LLVTIIPPVGLVSIMPVFLTDTATTQNYTIT
jgi:hypothetical protein